MGQAASMGSLLLAGGAPGRRACLPHASIMLHQPSGSFHGQASDVAIHAREMMRVRAQLNAIYQRHLTRRPLTLAQVEQLLDRDNFLSAEDARDLGVIDRILTPRAGARGDGGDAGGSGGGVGGGSDAGRSDGGGGNSSGGGDSSGAGSGDARDKAGGGVPGVLERTNPVPPVTASRSLYSI